jgi:hypothetical protein
MRSSGRIVADEMEPILWLAMAHRPGSAVRLAGIDEALWLEVTVGGAQRVGKLSDAALTIVQGVKVNGFEN